MYLGYIGKVESTKHAVQLAVSENIRKRTKNKLLIDTNMKINTASQPDIQNGARIDLRLFTKGNWAFSLSIQSSMFYKSTTAYS